MTTQDTLRDKVRDRYASLGRRFAAGDRSATCCAPPQGSTSLSPAGAVSTGLYPTEETSGLPGAALTASLGCGNPTALADLHPGDTVLDLGSGGGIDVLLSARRVGPEGKVYGLDMTPEMVELGRSHQREARQDNVEFLLGTIEDIPLPDSSVDVVISNCVINLSTDKDRVLREAFRVLRPGGRFAVADIVVRRPLPEEIRRSAELWAGCIAGALLASDYERKLVDAGFDEVSIEPFTMAADATDTATEAGGCCTTGGPDQTPVGDALMSAFIRATKPRS